MVPPPRAQVAGVSARGGCGLLPRLPPAACAPGVPLGVHACGGVKGAPAMTCSAKMTGHDGFFHAPTAPAPNGRPWGRGPGVKVPIHPPG